MRKAVGIVGEREQRDQLIEAPPDLARSHFFEAEGDVVGHAQVRKQGIILKHHADPPLLHGHMAGRAADRAPVDPDRALSWPLKAGDTAQQGGLAGAARPEQTGDPGPGQA